MARQAKKTTRPGKARRVRNGVVSKYAQSTWICIKFPDRQTQNEGVGFLACNYAGRLFKSGEVIVPEEALAALAAENITFTVIGRATDDQMAPFRSPTASAVQ